MVDVIFAILDFLLMAFNIYLAIERGNPISWATAAFCFAMGLLMIIKR